MDRGGERRYRFKVVVTITFEDMLVTTLMREWHGLHLRDERGQFTRICPTIHESPNREVCDKYVRLSLTTEGQVEVICDRNVMMTWHSVWSVETRHLSYGY